MFNLEDRIRTSLLAGRKRSWHSPDATDLHVQLQEADSTVADPSQSEDQEKKEKERTSDASMPEQEDRKRRRGMAESDDEDLPSLSGKSEQTLSNSEGEKMLKETDPVPRETKGTDSHPKTEPSEHQSMQCEDGNCEPVHPTDEARMKEGVVSLDPLEQHKQQQQCTGKGENYTASVRYTCSNTLHASNRIDCII